MPGAVLHTGVHHHHHITAACQICSPQHVQSVINSISHVTVTHSITDLADAGKLAVRSHRSDRHQCSLVMVLLLVLLRHGYTFKFGFCLVDSR